MERRRKNNGRTSREPSVDIAAWLCGLGLAEYEPTFRENAIDSAVLPNLTSEDLKDLGVILVGHRRSLSQYDSGVVVGPGGAIIGLIAGLVLDSTKVTRALHYYREAGLIH